MSVKDARDTVGSTDYLTRKRLAVLLMLMVSASLGLACVVHEGIHILQRNEPFEEVCFFGYRYASSLGWPFIGVGWVSPHSSSTSEFWPNLLGVAVALFTFSALFGVMVPSVGSVKSSGHS